MHVLSLAPQPASPNDLQLNKSLPHALGLPAHPPCEAVALISPFSQQQTPRAGSRIMTHILWEVMMIQKANGGGQ